ncbi:MAG: ATP-binding cassette domain-containing protein [Bacteroidales bacterium]
MLKLDKISVQVDNFQLKEITLEINRGDYVVLAGPSGAGKTMLLETIAGFRHPFQGSMYFQNRSIIKIRPEQRPITMLFQHLALFPHLSVRENIGYAVKPKKQKKSQVEQLAKDFDLKSHLDKPISKLSGGEQQRVALARVMAAKPELLLLDEPLSSLDNQLKHDFIQRLWQLNQQGQTIMHITHDTREALNLANKAGIMHQGQLHHFGPAKDFFWNIHDTYTAALLGYENIIDLRQAPNEFFSTNESGTHLAFKTSDIQTTKADNQLAINGTLLYRPSGHHWLNTKYGIIHLPPIIKKTDHLELTIFIPKEKILLLHD